MGRRWEDPRVKWSDNHVLFIFNCSQTIFSHIVSTAHLSCSTHMSAHVCPYLMCQLSVLIDTTITGLVCLSVAVSFDFYKELEAFLAFTSCSVKCQDEYTVPHATFLRVLLFRFETTQMSDLLSLTFWRGPKCPKDTPQHTKWAQQNWASGKKPSW